MLKILTAANGWEENVYEKIFHALDGANLKLTFSEKLSGDHSDNDVNYHLKKLFENRNDIKGDEATKRMLKGIWEEVFGNDVHIQYARDGSIICYLSVCDLKALMHIWEMHVGGELIANLAKILIPKGLQQTFLDKWKTEIDAAHYISELHMLIKRRYTTSKTFPRMIRPQGAIKIEKPPISHKGESSQPPLAPELKLKVKPSIIHKREPSPPRLPYEMTYKLEPSRTESLYGMFHNQLPADYYYHLSVPTMAHKFWQLEPSFSYKRESVHPPYAVMVDTSVPIDNFHQRVPAMAHKWDFMLDEFQKQAILCLEDKQSVFVSAHTSAGKTVVAEYAIALACKHNKKAIYTAPIKALSNQKYRHFKKIFGGEHIGLQTGDAQLNDNASCVIMTAEILRSKLYDLEELHGLEWVIIDEVHYISDETRGVILEEVLIMLPDTVNLVLLSATFSNTMEFARWVGKIKKKTINVITTEQRPVPLKHYVYTGTEEIVEHQLFQTVDVTGDFINENYEQALIAVVQNGIQTQAGLPNVKQKNRYPSFVKMLKEREYLPAIVFTFVRKKCRENALSLESSDLTDLKEKSQIKTILKSSLETLTETNQQLSQILELGEMLMRGIAYHHGGVLPLMKEIVEHLFQDNLVKVLFATETFASGVNMPARTVIFDSVKKFDGEEAHTLNPAEYIQMAGRAGRRGKDDSGFSIILYEESMKEVSVLRSLQQGKPCPVESQFHLKYNMILNLAKMAKFQVGDILRQSFAEYCRDSTEKELAALKLELRRNKRVSCIICRKDLSAYYDVCKKIHSLRSDLQSKCSVGQVVVVNSWEHSNVLGIVISKVDPNFKKFKTIVIYDKETSRSALKIKLKVPLVREIYLPKSDFSNSCDVVELETGDFTLTEVIPIDASTLEQISSSSVVPSSLFTTNNIKMLHRCARSELTEGEETKFLYIKQYERHVIKYECLRCENLQKHYENYDKRQELEEKILEAEEKLSKRSLLQLTEVRQKAKKRQKVLKGLNYLNADMSICLKGIVACNFSHHEIILTEVSFQGILDDLEPAEIAAALSCMVYHGKQPSEFVISKKVQEAIQNIKSIAKRIALNEQQYDVNVDVKDYVDQFKQCFAEVVFEWARGHSFEEIIHLASVNLGDEIPEGAIVHTMQQLIYICREILIACEENGKSDFAYKMKEATRMLERDIVAVPSLYLQ